MQDQEIYELAQDVLNSIVADLSGGIYKKLGGTLTLSWGTTPKVSAYAKSQYTPNSPPKHHVCVSYELVRTFYRDAELFHNFASTTLLESNVQVLYQGFDPKPELPKHLKKEEIIHNMFIGALTWVFFHELAHLSQEHGHIRNIFGNIQKTTIIEDCESVGCQILDPRTASISHTTEFAADIEATHWCTMELARHFLPLEQVVNSECKKEFSSNLYLLVCGISCAFYRFYGLSAINPEAIPMSSHPTPVRRLELITVNLFEKLDADGYGEKLHGLSRSQLINLCTGAADSSGFFWLWRNSPKQSLPNNFMLKGLLQDPHIALYWPTIINTWDEIESEIIDVRHFGSKFGILNFTHEFRSNILKISQRNN